MKALIFLVLCGLFTTKLSAQTWQVPEQYQKLNEAIKNGHLEDTETLLIAITQNKSLSAIDYYYKGRIAQLNNKLDDAVEYYEKAIELDPENHEFHFRFGASSLMLASTASFFSVPLHASNAKNSLQKAHRLNPTHMDSLQWLVRWHMFVPSIAGGSTESALQLVKKMESLNKVDAMVFELRLHRKEGELEQIRRCAEVVKQELPQSARALTAVGFAFQYQEKYPEAFEFFELASRTEPENEEDISPRQALYQLGKTAALWQQSLEQGAKALQQYAELDLNDKTPSLAWSQYRLAQIMLLQGKIAQANKYAELAKQTADEDELNKKLKVLTKQIKRRS